MDWELTERSRKCALCQKTFNIGDYYKTALFMDDKKVEELMNLEAEAPKSSRKKNINIFANTAKRFEFCPDCWMEKLENTQPDCLWKGTFLKKEEQNAASSVLKKEDILSIFKEYMEKIKSSSVDDERVENIGVTYFLAVMLERKNILSFKQSLIDDETGIRQALYVIGKTGDEFYVPYPFLSPETIELYQQKMNELLDINEMQKKKV